MVRDALPPRFYSQASQIYHKIPAGIEAAILYIKIRRKWYCDRRCLPLTHEHRELYDIIHRLTWKHLGEFPNLVNCRDFNDRIQWLKLFDQNEDTVLCCNKLLVRDYITEKISDKYLSRIYQTGDRFEDLNFDELPNAFVIKVNHDSGNVILVRDKQTFQPELLKERIDYLINKVYGWDFGEWAYGFIKPRVFIEEYLNPESTSPPADYKFHCVNGRVKWLQYIFDRGSATKEVNTDRNGNVMRNHFDHHMQHVEHFEKSPVFDKLVEIAEQLSDGWKYVRVDLYLSKGRIYVGEMTFFPYCGVYQGGGQKQLGQLLDFDRTTFKPPIYHKLKRAE